MPQKGVNNIMSRQQVAIKNSTMGLISQIVTLIFQFWTRSIFVKYLGVELLGISSTFSSILNTLSLAELGFQSAVVYSLYKPLANDNKEKVNEIYKNKFNELPKTIVFDTITHLYLDITNFNRRNYSGFDIHSQNNDDAQSLNEFIENKLIREKNINIVLMAHTTIEPKTNRFSVPAQGSFARAGGFVSFVDESIYIDRNEEHLIVLKDPTNAVVRSVLKYDEDKFVVHFNTFNINKHLAALEHISNDSEESKL